MNDSTEPTPSEEDRLGELLSPLRRAEPTAPMRRANRRAARAALVRPTTSSWWQHSVSVPAPVAALAAGVLLAVGWGLGAWRSISSDPPAPVVVEAPAPAPVTPIADTGAPAYTTKASYFPGVGFVSRQTTYHLENPL
ncbi:hypothetical protein [Botrimarina sp.]|uniref:hypothetical protein n=1 Tax=Botrimarina sp. TaxID=2795802 RepID=UPI0032EBC9D2